MKTNLLPYFALAIFLSLWHAGNGGIIETVKTQEEVDGKEMKETEENIKKELQPCSSKTIFVHVSDDEIPATFGTSATLPCDFDIFPASDEPVRVTWRIGDGPRESTPIAYCYDYVDGSCRTFDVTNDGFRGRIAMMDGKTPSLTINDITSADNLNFWCEVQTQSPTELGTDMKSVVLRVVQSENERPKFERVNLGEDAISGGVGERIALDCSCSGYHCDNVYWYKGPTYAGSDDSYRLIYSKENHFNRDPVVKYGEGYEERISIQGYSLILNGVQESDAGRYWCEARGADFYTLGETGTDAKSLVFSLDG